MIYKKPHKNFTKRIRYILILALLTFTHHSSFTQDEWNVSENLASKVSPFEFNQESIETGQALYQKNCLSCHGTPGQANYANLTPIPGDIQSEKIQDQTDGSIYTKITDGRGLMPKFKNILSDDERWQLVAYIRSFNKDYVQPTLAQIDEALEAAKTKLLIEILEESKQIKILALNTEQDEIPVRGVNVSLYAKRYFGNLSLGENSSTDENGIAFFDYPDDLPGDKDGYINLIARINNTDLFGDSEVELNALIGIKTDIPSLTEPRAMWNVMSKAPLWLIFTFTGIFFLVWGSIIYILFQLYKLWKHGSKNKTA